jgi:hypothetical protein
VIYFQQVDLELEFPQDISTPSAFSNRTSFLSLSLEALSIDDSLVESVPVCMKPGIGHQFHTNSIQLNFFCSRTQYLVIQSPDTEEVNN